MPSPALCVPVNVLRCPQGSACNQGPSVCFHLSLARFSEHLPPSSVFFHTQSINTTKSFTLIYDSGFILILPTLDSEMSNQVLDQPAAGGSVWTCCGLRCLLH